VIAMADFRDLVGVLQRDRVLCLPCKETLGTCPRCRTGARLFALA